MYNSRPFTESEKLLSKEIRDTLCCVEALLKTNTAASRTQSIALTHLEEAMLYSNLAIADSKPKEP